MPHKTFFNLSKERQDDILDKALDFYLTVPFEKITLRRLTEALNMPMGTFYRYFGDKDELFLYLCDQIDAQFERNEDIIDKPAYDRPEENKGPERHKQITENFHKMPEEILRRFYFDFFIHRSVPLHLKELRRLKERGALREDIDIDLTAFMYATSMYNLNIYLNQKNITDEEERWNARKSLFYSMFKYGIMKREG